MKDGIVCRQYTPGPHSDKLIVPIIPKADQQKVLYQCHDVPKAGHVGSDKTAMKVRQLGYWVGMLHDINQYCSECVTCQSSKSPAPQKVPLISMPIGKPWEMVAVDILQVPTLCQNHRYILVIQDYFTKWAEAIPLPNQTAATITRELVKVFSNYGLPEILHSDQVATSKVLCYNRHWMHLALLSLEQQPTTHKGMEWSSDLIAHCSKCYVHMYLMRQTGRNFFHW